MSHAHIHEPRPQPTPPSRIWLFATAGVTVGLLLALFGAARIRDSQFDTSHLTTMGKVSETRIVIDHTWESTYGGRIFYRIEAHVSYEIQGRPEDRWLTASDITSSRAMLETTVAHSFKECQVYWAADHPENAKCRFHLLP